VSRATTWTRVREKIGGNRSKESGTAEVVRRLPDTKTTPLRPIFFALSPKPIERFRRKRARLSLFRPQPHLPSFIQIRPSVRELLAKTTFQIVTIIATHNNNKTGPHEIQLHNFSYRPTAEHVTCCNPQQSSKNGQMTGSAEPCFGLYRDVSLLTLSHHIRDRT